MRMKRSARRAKSEWKYRLIPSGVRLEGVREVARKLISQLFRAALRCADIDGVVPAFAVSRKMATAQRLGIACAAVGLFTRSRLLASLKCRILLQLIEMIKSALGLARFSGLRESALVNGRLTSALARLNVITSKNVCTTRWCGKEIRTQTEKVKVGVSSKYGLVDGETTPETVNINEQ